MGVFRDQFKYSHFSPSFWFVSIPSTKLKQLRASSRNSYIQHHNAFQLRRTFPSSLYELLLALLLENGKRRKTLKSNSYMEKTEKLRKLFCIAKWNLKFKNFSFVFAHFCFASPQALRVKKASFEKVSSFLNEKWQNLNRESFSI